MKFQPRYVDLPALRERGHGPRNIWWGVFTFILAIGLFGFAVFFAGAKAAISLGICLLTFSALYVMAKLHLFRQRNGGFLALSIVCLLGALVALGERGFVAVDAMMKNQGGVIALTPAAAHATESDAPLLTQSFALTAPDAKKRQVRILYDSKIVIGGKPFAIKVGDLFPYVESKDSETTFAVRDLHVALPASVVEIIEPGAEVRKVSSAEAVTIENPRAKAPASAKSEPAKTAVLSERQQITNSAILEAARRYPALGVKDSRENKLFLTTVEEMRHTGEMAFFETPEWPIILAEQLAKSESWPRDNQVGAPTASAGLPTAQPAVNPDTLPPDDLPSIIPKDGAPR